MNAISFVLDKIKGTQKPDVTSRVGTSLFIPKTDIVDARGVYLGFTDYGAGTMYYKKIKDEIIPVGYLVDTEPFHTTLQFLHHKNRKFVFQDLYPSEQHHGYTPLYEFTAPHVADMLLKATIEDGRIEGTFEITSVSTMLVTE